jgi:hypothetical protein
MVKAKRGSGSASKRRGNRKMRTEMHGDSTGGGDHARLDARIQTEIGKHLRAMYEPVLNEPVPAKFMDLLEKLERSTARKR